jgi:hypothetical protein
MTESSAGRSPVTSGMMTQYSAIGNDLRFYADQRFKIAGAFLVATGLLANVAKDERSPEEEGAPAGVLVPCGD